MRFLPHRRERGGAYRESTGRAPGREYFFCLVCNDVHFRVEM